VAAGLAALRLAALGLWMFGLSDFSALAAGKPRLLTTAPGQTELGGTRVTVSPSTAQSNAISYSVSFNVRRANTFGAEFGPPVIEVTTRNTVQDLPVRPGAWGFHLRRASEVWFHDGFGAFTRLRIVDGELQVSASCSDPNLSARAPRALKRRLRAR
jgi:hypothetical protein